MVGQEADGASANRGDKPGVKTKFWEDIPLLVLGWSMAHKLELGIQDALKGICFDNFDERLLRIYCLYKQSPKSKLGQKPVELYPSIAYLKQNIAENNEGEMIL